MWIIFIITTTIILLTKMMIKLIIKTKDFILHICFQSDQSMYLHTKAAEVTEEINICESEPP